MMEKRLFRVFVPCLVSLFFFMLIAEQCFALQGRGRGRRGKAHQERMKEVKKRLSGVMTKKELGAFFKKVRAGDFTEKEFAKLLSQGAYKRALKKADVNFLKEELKGALLRKKKAEKGKEPSPGRFIQEKLAKHLGYKAKNAFWKKFKNGGLSEKELLTFLDQEKLKGKLAKADINKIKQLRKEYELKAEAKRKKKEKEKEKRK